MEELRREIKEEGMKIKMYGVTGRGRKRGIEVVDREYST